jgi:hypothetical protein
LNRQDVLEERMTRGAVSPSITDRQAARHPATARREGCSELHARQRCIRKAITISASARCATISLADHLSAAGRWRNRSAGKREIRFSRGGHHAVPVRAADARGGGAAPARTHGWRPEARGVDRWIRQRRREDERDRAGSHIHLCPGAQPTLITPPRQNGFTTRPPIIARRPARWERI